MKRAILYAALLASALSSSALPTYDYFNYTAGQPLAGQTNPDGLLWYNLNTSASITNATVVDPGSIWSGANVPVGFPTPSGNAVLLSGNFANVAGNGGGGNLLYGATVTNGAIYASFFLTVADLSNIGASGAFWACFNNETGNNGTVGTTEAGRILMRGGSGTYQLGCTKTSGTGSDWVFESASHNQGDVLFVVTSYSFVEPSNDVMSVWINPAPSDFGTSVAPDATISVNRNTSTASGDIAAVRGFGLLDRATGVNTKLPNSFYVDDLHLGRSWAYVTGGPEITNKPPATVNLGYNSNVVLNAQATAIAGAPTLIYQWQRNGANVANSANVIGATTASLTLTNVTSGQAGTYQCVVANTIGNTTSSASVVTVSDPFITQQPPAITNTPPGSVAVISVAATGTPTITYKWQKNGTPMNDGGNISGSSTASLTISSTSSADNGTYACVVKNGLNTTITSSNCVFSVTDPAITTEPQSATVNYGTTKVFSTAAVGTGPFTYGWQRNGANITDGPTASGATASGATTANLTLSGVAFADGGTYTVTVTNGIGATATSVPATLVVVDPIIVNQPQSTAVLPGATATFHVDAAGTAPLTYKWRRNTTVLTDVGQFSGTTTDTLTIANCVDTNNNNYNVIVSGISGTNVTSSNATLTVNSPATIVVPPVSRVQHAGENAVLSVAVTGLAPISLQWSRNGSPINGATTNNLVFNNAQTSDNATYSVQVSNAFATNTATATLTISPNYVRFYPTNLVISRIGDGAEALNLGDGTTISLDQYTRSGGYVSTITIPDNTNVNSQAMVVSGQDTSSGAAGLGEVVLGSSPDNHYVGFGGYNISRNPGASTAAVSSGATTVTPRAAGVVNGLGYYQMTWRNNTTFPNGSLRSVVPDNTGTSFYAVGGSSGLRLVNGSTATLIDSVATGGNNRVVAYFNGGLYISAGATGANPQGIYFYYSPPTAATAPNVLFNTNTVTSITWNQGQNEFSISPDGNTVYFANGDFNKSTGNGIERWDNVNGTWTRSYTFSVGGVGARGLYVDWSGFSGGLGAVVFATTAQTNNNYLVTGVDNGSSSPITVLAQAGTNQVFRSIRAAPVADAATIAAQPQNQKGALGSKAVFSVTANGTVPINYQWRKNGVALNDGPSGVGSTYSGATTAALTISGLVNGDLGSYSVVAGNGIGGQTSSSATLALVDPSNFQRLTQIWSQAPGSQTYLPADTDPQGRSPLYRSLAYNALSNQLLIVSRPSGTPTVTVLNASTGAAVYTLNTTGVSGGLISLNAIAVGDDGVVYATDISTAGAASTDFKLYRWATTDPTAAPTQIYTTLADPGLAVFRRWGDVLSVSGSEPNTQIMLDAASADSSGSTVRATILSTAGDLAPFSTLWPYSGSDSIGRTMEFAPASYGANAFMQKRKGTALRIESFDLNSQSSTSLATYGNFAPSIGQVTFISSNLMAALDYSGGDTAAATPDYVDLLEVSDLNRPTILNQVSFPVNHQPNGDYNGCIIYRNNTVYALDSNNGLVAMQLGSSALPALTAKINGSQVTLSWNDTTGAAGATLQYSTLLTSGSWTNDPNTVVTGSGQKSVTEPVSGKKFYRLIK